MKSRIFSALLIAACWASQTVFAAPDPAKTPIIEELFQLTKPETLLKQMLGQYKSAFGNAAQNGFNSEVRKMGDDPSKYQGDFQDLQNRLYALMSSRLNWQTLKPQFVQVYSDTFTKDELSGLVAFYKSPAGKASIDKTPGLVAKCSTIGQQQMAGAGPEMQKMMNDFMNGIKQKSQTAHPSQTQPKQ